MSLVPLLKSDEFAEADQAPLAAGEKAYGKILNTWAAIGNSPGLFAVYLPFLKQINGPGALDDRIKDLAAVRVAILNHCRYTASHRCASAQAKGVTADQLAAIASGDFEGFDDRERLALQLASELTVAVPTVPREQSLSGISSEVRRDAERLFGPAELVELAMSISMWNALSRFHRVMEFDLDMPEPPPGVDDLV